MGLPVGSTRRKLPIVFRPFMRAPTFTRSPELSSGTAVSRPDPRVRARRVIPARGLGLGALGELRQRPRERRAGLESSHASLSEAHHAGWDDWACGFRGDTGGRDATVRDEINAFRVASPCGQDPVSLRSAYYRRTRSAANASRVRHQAVSMDGWVWPSWPCLDWGPFHVKHSPFDTPPHEDISSR